MYFELFARIAYPYGIAIPSFLASITILSRWYSLTVCLFAYNSLVIIRSSVIPSFRHSCSQRVQKLVASLLDSMLPVWANEQKSLLNYGLSTVFFLYTFQNSSASRYIFRATRLISPQSRHHRPPQRRRSLRRRPRRRSQPLHPLPLRHPRPRRRHVLRLRHRLGSRPLLHSVRAAPRRRRDRAV